MELPSAEYTNIGRLLCWIFWATNTERVNVTLCKGIPAAHSELWDREFSIMVSWNMHNLNTLWAKNKSWLYEELTNIEVIVNVSLRDRPCIHYGSDAVGVWIWIFIFTYHGFWEYTQSEYLVIEKQIMGAWRAHKHRIDCKCIFAWQAMDMHITFFVAASNAMRPTHVTSMNTTDMRQSWAFNIG